MVRLHSSALDVPNIGFKILMERLFNVPGAHGRDYSMFLVLQESPPSHIHLWSIHLVMDLV